MRFRDADESDIPAIVACFQGRNALPVEPAVRAALPAALQQLISSPACTLTVFEDDQWTGPQVLSFAGGLFVRDSLIEAYLAAPRPALVASILAAVVAGGRPLLTLAEIRRANAGEGLTLVLFPVPLDGLAWDDPKAGQLRMLAPLAFVRSFGGYRLQAIYYEVFTDEVAGYVQAAGYRLLHDFSGQAGTGILSPDCRPRMLRLARAEVPPAAMSVAAQAFDPPRARLGLTLAEQRVALRALDGASDRAIAGSFALSVENGAIELALDLPAARARARRRRCAGVAR